MASEHRGRSLLVESITIVLSILLAFAIDAAWDSRHEREEEMRFLGSIDAEIAQNLERIEGARRFRTWKRAAALELLDLSVRAEGADAAQIDARSAALTWFDVGRWQTDAVDTLLAGGRLAVVEDLALRRKIVTLPATIAALVKVETMDQANCLGSFIPYLIREGSFAQVVNANVSYPPDATPDLAPSEQAAAPYQKLPVAAPRDHRELLARSEYLGLVTQAYTDQEDLLFMLDHTKRQLRDVQAAIRAELGDAAPPAEAKP